MQVPHGHDFVPVFDWLVVQSPILQPALQVLVWVKVWPEQTVDVAGDHRSVPHPMHDFAPFALRLSEQSPVLQPALQVRAWVKV